MKKTVIIAIILCYIASILVVQFFGLRVVEMQGNVYINAIQVRGFEFTNRDDIEDSKYHKVVPITNTSGIEELHYAGYFYPGEYDMSPESLASNPNRVRILYDVEPYNASNQDITLDFDRNATQKVIYYDEETHELVFLRPRTVTIILNSHDGSTVRTTVKVSLQ